MKAGTTYTVKKISKQKAYQTWDVYYISIDSDEVTLSCDYEVSDTLEIGSTIGDFKNLISPYAYIVLPKPVSFK